jgi:Tfp pilus assembly protein FimT
MSHVPDPSPRDAGFSLIEQLALTGLIGVMASIALLFYSNAVATVQGDADLRILEWHLKLAREAAINQRRSVEVRFTQPNLVSVVRRDLPNGTTLLAQAYFEHNTRYLVFPGTPDTPDGFGRATGLDFAGAAVVMFTPDGMFTDGGGNALNGTISLGQPGHPGTGRAITVFGPTGRIRTYRWNGSQWRH